jgi:hypothetical protein
MAQRKALNDETVREVLVLCRRRCCICFGLNRDTALRQGQIAHLDRNSENDAMDNLAYLCLEHHDQYDSRTSQSKGITPSEVRQFRKELHEAIEHAWKESVKFGSVDFRPSAGVGGHYVRDGNFSSAELTVVPIGEDRVRVTGLALWGKGRQYGPNLGDLNFEAELSGHNINFEDRTSRDDIYQLTLEFDENGLTAKESYVVGYFGMNVSFAGAYKKT